MTLTGCRRGSRPEERREEGGRKEEGRGRATLTGWYTLLSLYCAVPTEAGRSFGAGGVSRTGKAKPCKGCGRPDYGGGTA